MCRNGSPVNSMTQVLRLSGVHGPENLVNVEPGSGTAVNITVVPGGQSPLCKLLGLRNQSPVANTLRS